MTTIIGETPIHIRQSCLRCLQKMTNDRPIHRLIYKWYASMVSFFIKTSLKINRFYVNHSIFIYFFFYPTFLKYPVTPLHYTYMPDDRRGGIILSRMSMQSIQGSWRIFKIKTKKFLFPILLLGVELLYSSYCLSVRPSVSSLGKWKLLSCH